MFTLRLLHALLNGLRLAAAWGLCVSLTIWAGVARASEDAGGKSQLNALVQEWVSAHTGGGQSVALAESVAPGARVEIVLGQLDPRLKLAPCQQVKAYMPDGAKLWGKSRVGLRCEVGATKWNVSWPITVKVWAPGLVAVETIDPGQPVSESQFAVAEVDVAADASPVLTAWSEVEGRTMQRRITPGQALRANDLRARRWFSAGDPVKLLLKGSGFVATSQGTALSHGDEGRCARIRTEQGKVLCAHPTSAGVAELSL